MITLERDGKRMEVATDLQASAFESNGYVRVAAAWADLSETSDSPAEAGAVSPEKPKRRSRKKPAESRQDAGLDGDSTEA